MPDRKCIICGEVKPLAAFPRAVKRSRKCKRCMHMPMPKRNPVASFDTCEIIAEYQALADRHGDTETGHRFRRLAEGLAASQPTRDKPVTHKIRDAPSGRQEARTGRKPSVQQRHGQQAEEAAQPDGDGNTT